jgi:ABC-type multidrug transport system ATPase subunit
VSAALQLRGLRKRYGRRHALDGFDLEVPAGSMLGLVGSNGAGKTTAFAIVGGCIAADAGEVDILGAGPFRPERHAGRLTLLPQDSDLPRHARVNELLYFYARLQGVPGPQARRQAAEVLEWVHLADRADSAVRTLSHVMKRRVMVAQAFLGDPELILLDEPLNGLDPKEVVNIRNFLRARRGRQTIVISSHNLHEIELVCDRVAFIEKGRLVRTDTLEAITGRANVLRYLVDPGPLPAEELRAACADADFTLDPGEIACRYGAGRQAADLNAAVLPILLRHGVRLRSIEQGDRLENVYMDQHRAPPAGSGLPGGGGTA